MSSHWTTNVATVILCASLTAGTAISLTGCGGDDSSTTSAQQNTSGQQPGPPPKGLHQPGGSGVGAVQDPNASPPQGG